MIEVVVCIGSACHLKGSYNVINTFQQIIEEYNLNDKVDLRSAFCLGRCQQGVSVNINDESFSVSPTIAGDFFKTKVVSLIKE